MVKDRVLSLCRIPEPVQPRATWSSPAGRQGVPWVCGELRIPHRHSRPRAPASHKAGQTHLDPSCYSTEQFGQFGQESERREEGGERFGCGEGEVNLIDAEPGDGGSELSLPKRGPGKSHWVELCPAPPNSRPPRNSECDLFWKQSL